MALLHACCSLLWRVAHGDKSIAPTMYKATAGCTMPVATANMPTCSGASPVVPSTHHVYLCWQVCGIKYQRGVQSSLLPEVPADADRVPESYLLQIVRKPKQRSERKPITRFKLLTPLNQVCLLFPSSCPDSHATCRQLAVVALVCKGTICSSLCCR